MIPPSHSIIPEERPAHRVCFIPFFTAHPGRAFVREAEDETEQDGRKIGRESPARVGPSGPPVPQGRRDDQTGGDLLPCFFRAGAGQAGGMKREKAKIPEIPMKAIPKPIRPGRVRPTEQPVIGRVAGERWECAGMRLDGSPGRRVSPSLGACLLLQAAGGHLFGKRRFRRPPGGKGPFLSFRAETFDGPPPLKSGKKAPRLVVLAPSIR
nr:hypothetical protein [Bacillota bacterium]